MVLWVYLPQTRCTHYTTAADTLVHLMCATDVVIMLGFSYFSCVCDVVTQSGFHCEICHRMLKDRKAVLQHINVDTHIGQIEVCTDIIQQ